MIDRHGNRIDIGWAPHEILWLEAALTLRMTERMPAYQDIAEMTGRSVRAIQAKATGIIADSRATARRIMVAGPADNHAWLKFPASQITPPSKAMLTAGRAR